MLVGGQAGLVGSEREQKREWAHLIGLLLQILGPCKLALVSPCHDVDWYGDEFDSC